MTKEAYLKLIQERQAHIQELRDGLDLIRNAFVEEHRILKDGDRVLFSNGCSGIVKSARCCLGNGCTIDEVIQSGIVYKMMKLKKDGTESLMELHHFDQRPDFEILK